MSLAVAMTSRASCGSPTKQVAGFLSCLRRVGIVNPLFGADYHQMICFDPIAGPAAGRFQRSREDRIMIPNPCEPGTYHMLNFFCRCNECHVLLNCCLRVPRTRQDFLSSFSGSIVSSFLVCVGTF
jgi:hypothetical protein